MDEGLAEISFRDGNMIEIRRAKPLDFEKVYEIECLVKKQPWGMLDFYDDFINNPRSIWYIAEKEGKIIGFGGMWRGVDEFHIVNLAITNPERGKGYGKELVKKMLEDAMSEKPNMVLLEVRASNAVAKSLYVQFGFRELYVRKNYYQEDGEDGIIMVLESK